MALTTHELLKVDRATDERCSTCMGTGLTEALNTCDLCLDGSVSLLRAFERYATLLALDCDPAHALGLNDAPEVELALPSAWLPSR